MKAFLSVSWFLFPYFLKLFNDKFECLQVLMFCQIFFPNLIHFIQFFLAFDSRGFNDLVLVNISDWIHLNVFQRFIFYLFNVIFGYLNWRSWRVPKSKQFFPNQVIQLINVKIFIVFISFRIAFWTLFN